MGFEGEGNSLDGTYKGITFICIVITLILIVLISFYQARNEEGTACFGHKYMNTSNKELQNSAFILTDSDESILQPYEINNKGNIDYTFCYAISSNVTDAFRVHVVNENNTILATEFVHNATTNYCTDINGELLSDKGYIGLRCDTCKANQKICIKQEILGHTTKIVKNNGTVEINFDNSLSYELKSKEDCDRMITFFVRWYITLISFLALGVLIFFGGYEKLKKLFIDKNL